MAETSNGTTFSFGGSAQSDVRSVTYTESADEIPVTVLGSAAHLVEAGLTKITCDIETVGVSTITVGATGALAISYTDGSSESVAGVVCLSKTSNGSLDTEITSSLTFAQSS